MRQLVLILLICTVDCFAVEELNNFSHIFNNYKSGMSSKESWSSSRWEFSAGGVNNKNIKGQEGESPINRFDKFFEYEDKATSYEEKFHHCNPEEISCASNYDHSKGLAFSIIREQQPKEELFSINPKKKKYRFTKEDQIGLLAEKWNQNSFSSIGHFYKKVVDENIWNELNNSFWDITPKKMFYALTRFIGIQKSGIVVDNKTGLGKDYRAIVGYKYLPISSNDILPPERRGRLTLFPVRLHLKYFYNKVNVLPHQISKKFDISDISNEKLITFKSDFYEGRVLSMTIFLDSPIKLDTDNSQILESGNIVGEGLWAHQSKEGNTNVDSYKFSQPDVLLIPHLLKDSISENPYVNNRSLRYIKNQKVGNNHSSKVPDRKKILTTKFKIANYLEYYPHLKFYKPEFHNHYSFWIEKHLDLVFNRSGVAHIISRKDIRIELPNVVVKIKFLGAYNQKKVLEALRASGLSIDLTN